MKSTPIKVMEETAAIHPLDKRRDAKIMGQTEKYKCLPNHPMRQRMNGITNNRFKHSSFIHDSKSLAKEHQDSIPSSTLPLDPSDLQQPLTEDHFILRSTHQFHTSPHGTLMMTQPNLP
ncbi:hypothetical protein BaRGS_00012117 [Batillaria attramentaria]|uniref:Uncharacterized protein n=1 Tax=Batillaria attramentaria TaxID=370345 RepID=A0ABD0LBJ8_9CAEN